MKPAPPVTIRRRSRSAIRETSKLETPVAFGNQQASYRGRPWQKRLGSGLVVLDEAEVDASRLVPSHVVGLQENPALITMNEGLDRQDAGQRGFTHSDHLGLACILVIPSDMLRYTLRI